MNEGEKSEEKMRRSRYRRRKEQEDEELRKAIESSLQDQSVETAPAVDEDDRQADALNWKEQENEELRKAFEASLQDQSVETAPAVDEDVDKRMNEGEKSEKKMRRSRYRRRKEQEEEDLRKAMEASLQDQSVETAPAVDEDDRQADALSEKEQENEELRKAFESSLQDQSVETAPAVDEDDRQADALNWEQNEILQCEVVENVEGHSDAVLTKQAQLSDGSCASFLADPNIHDEERNDPFDDSDISMESAEKRDSLRDRDHSCSSQEQQISDFEEEQPQNSEIYDDDVTCTVQNDEEICSNAGRFKSTDSMFLASHDDNYSVNINNVPVTLCVGNITRKKMDALVNLTSSEGKLDTGLSKAFLKVGGDSLRLCHETADSQYTYVTVTEVTPDCKLSCKYILHVQRLRRGQKYCQQSIEGAMADIADVCQQKGITSLALPPLGISKAFGYTANDVATHMIQNIDKHLNFLQEMKIVVHETDIEVHDTFRAKLESYNGGFLSERQEEYFGDNLEDNLHENKPAMAAAFGTRPKQFHHTGKYSQDTRRKDSNSMSRSSASKHQWHGGNAKMQKRPSPAHQMTDDNSTPRRENVDAYTTRKRETGSQIADRRDRTYKKSFPRNSSITRECKDKIRQIITNAGVTVTPGKGVFTLTGNKSSVDQAYAEIKSELDKMGSKDAVKKVTTKKSSSDFIKYMATECEPSVPCYWDKPAKSLKTLFTDFMNLFIGNKYHKYALKTDSDVHRMIVGMMNETFDPSKLGKGNDAAHLQGYSKLWVVKVQRIENVSLYEKYVMKRQELFRKLYAKSQDRCKPVGEVCRSGEALTETYRKKYPNSELWKDVHPHVNELYMFHGTQADNVSVICKDGLDSRLCQDNAMLGRGIYGAESAMKSDQYADSWKNRSYGKGQEKKMLLIRMLLGDCFVSTGTNPPKYKRPPCKRCVKDVCKNPNHKESFDSVVSDCGKMFREFVVYNSDFCYPEYLITYERR